MAASAQALQKTTYNVQFRSLIHTIPGLMERGTEVGETWR
jgi:hypothetical protein